MLPVPNGQIGAKMARIGTLRLSTYQRTDELRPLGKIEKIYHSTLEHEPPQRETSYGRLVLGMKL
jgi:hypothetical protein